MAVVSRTAMTADESHDAWLAVFAAVTAPPADPRRAPCPNCGHFAVGFQYVADPASRLGFCALWCDNCGHGHVLSRTRVPEGIDFLPLDAPEDQFRAAIPDFRDVTSAQAARESPRDSAAIARRLAQLRPQVAEYELLQALWSNKQVERHLLSPREREVASLLRRGVHVAEIAQRLEVSRATVRTMIQRIYWKLGRDVSGKFPR